MERIPSKKGRKFWGEPWWEPLHSAAASYTPDQAQAYKSLVKAYTALIPCHQCRDHFRQNLIKYPIDRYLKNNVELLFWTYIIHDAVNQTHNIHRPDDTPKVSPPFEQVRVKYMRPQNWEKSWWFVLHSAAASYEEDHADDYISLVYAYTILLPKQTREQFKRAIAKAPVERYLRNNQELFFWSYLIFDMVTRTSPTIKLVPYEDVRRYYFMGLGEECKACNL